MASLINGIVQNQIQGIVNDKARGRLRMYLKLQIDIFKQILSKLKPQRFGKITGPKFHLYNDFV